MSEKKKSVFFSPTHNAPPKSMAVLLQNIFSLSILELVNKFLPLLTLPYLLRVLGPDRYGLIIFAQAIVSYFALLVEFGFNLSATKEIAVYGDDPKKINKLFSAVISSKLILFLSSFLILTILILTIPRLNEEAELFYLTFSKLFGDIFFPLWLFQGMQKMKYVTIIQLCSKVFFTVMIFFLIASPDDYYLVPILYAAGSLIAGLGGVLVSGKLFGVRFVSISFAEIYQSFHDSAVFFLSRLSVAFFTATNLVALGVFLDNSAVAYYAAAEKLYNALLMFIRPVADSVYPHMARSRDIAFFKKIFKVIVGLNTAVWLIILLASPLILEIIWGKQYLSSIPTLRILCLAGMLNIPSIMIGFPLLGALGFVGWANYSVVAAGCLHLALLGLAIPVLNSEVVASLVVISQLTILGIRSYGIRKNRIFNEIKKRI